MKHLEDTLCSEAAGRKHAFHEARDYDFCTLVSGVALFDRDPPSTPYQEGYLSALILLLEIRAA